MYAYPHICESFVLIHSKVSLSVWRDEAHGRLRRDDDDSVDDDENPRRQADNAEANTPSSPAPRSSPSRSSPRGSSPTSQTDHLPEPRPASGGSLSMNLLVIHQMHHKHQPQRSIPRLMEMTICGTSLTTLKQHPQQNLQVWPPFHLKLQALLR